MSAKELVFTKDRRRSPELVGGALGPRRAVRQRRGSILLLGGRRGGAGNVQIGPVRSVARDAGRRRSPGGDQ